MVAASGSWQQTDDPLSHTHLLERAHRWIRRFERLRVASGLASREGDIQINTLIYAIKQTTFSDRSRFPTKTASRIRQRKFDNHFIQRRIIFERAKFNRRRQEENEPAEAFITDLYALAEHCGYGDLHDEMIRDRIVVNSTLSEKLQLDASLTLDRAITQVEVIKQQQLLLRGQQDAPVGAVRQGKGRPNKTKPKNKQYLYKPQTWSTDVHHVW